MTTIEKIKAEIERLKNYAEESKKEWVKEGYNQNAFAEDCRISSFDKLLSFLSTIESEKPMNQEGLEEEVNRWMGSTDCFPEGVGITPLPKAMEIVERTASHFAQWGAEHIADVRKMIEPEKKKGRTDCSPQGEVPNGNLATQSYENIPKDLEKELIDWCGKFNPSIREEIQSTAYHFAGWQKEQDDRLVDIIYQQGIEKGKDEIRKTLKRKEKK